MPNALDTFLANGNQHFSTIANDEVTWGGVAFACTVSDLDQEDYFSDDGIGKKNNAERLLEFWREVFTGTEPQIGDDVTYDGTVYQIIKVESRDTTNVVYRIRDKMEVAS